MLVSLDFHILTIFPIERINTVHNYCYITVRLSSSVYMDNQHDWKLKNIFLHLYLITDQLF